MRAHLDWRWLVKTQAVFLVTIMITFVAASINVVVPGLALLLLAWRYDALRGCEEWLEPPCVNRFSPDERELIDHRHRQSSRIGMVILGISMVIRGMVSGPMPIWGLPFALLLIWLVSGLLYVTTNEILRSRIALGSETYEQYAREYGSMSRWTLAICLALAFVISHRFVA